MTRGTPDVDRLLRWYPQAWRDRYGDELAALVEDELDGGRPTVRLRLSLVTAGLAQRARSAALIGRDGAPTVRVRTGALVVLVAWSAAVVAGCVFAKTSEHFLTVARPSSLDAARAAYRVVVGAAAGGAALVLAAAVLAAPATVRFLRAGGWGTVRRRVWAAVGATVVLGSATVLLAAWAHGLDVAQRNGRDPLYSAAFVVWAVLVVAVLGLWTVAGVAVAGRLELGTPALRAVAVLAGGVAVSTVVLAGGVAVWWAAIARVAPWYLGGTAPGSRPSPWTPNLLGVEGLLVAATVVAAYGVGRMAHTWRSLAAG